MSFLSFMSLSPAALSRPGAKPRDQGRPRRNLSDYGRRVKPLPGLEFRPTRAFRANLPALDLFPTTLWAQIAARRLRSVSAKLLMVIPSDLIPAFDAAKSVSTRHAPLLDQAVLCDFITEGYFGRHLRRMRE